MNKQTLAPEVQPIIHTVQHNCDISDARHAGKYSMCTFLLKMREYYRWQQGIPLSQGMGKDSVGKWLVEHETYWEDLYSDAYKPLEFEVQSLGAFDTPGINQQLSNQDIVYSAGRGVFSKPHFFIGHLINYIHQDDVDIYICGDEYARDLVAPPAMLCNNQIFIRQQSIRRFIWEKIEENRWRKLKDSPVIRSAREHGFDLTSQSITTHQFERLLDNMMSIESQSALQHELGEVAAGRRLPTEWNEMLIGLSGSQAEFIARAVRDHLADAITTLPWLLQEECSPALHFYFANYAGLRKALFPQALNAYNTFISQKSRSALEDTCAKMVDHWQQEATNLVEIFSAEDAADSAQKIEAHYHDQIYATA